MLDGVIFTWRDLPDVFVSDHDLGRFIFSPSDETERQYRFLRQHRPRLIPVWWDGGLRIAFWGASGTRLPRDGVARQESLERGVWANLRPRETTVPCPFAIDGGRTYQVREGIRALVVADGNEQLHAYVLTEPSSPYYFTMTRRERMPVFVASDFGSV